MLRLSFVTAPELLRKGKHADVGEQCSFSLRERSSLGRLVTASAVSICSSCIQRCVTELQMYRIGPWRRWWDLRLQKRITDEPIGSLYRSLDLTFSFCRNERCRDTIVAEYARTCSPCVRLALDILLEDDCDRRH